MLRSANLMYSPYEAMHFWHLYSCKNILWNLWTRLSKLLLQSDALLKRRTLKTPAPETLPSHYISLSLQHMQCFCWRFFQALAKFGIGKLFYEFRFFCNRTQTITLIWTSIIVKSSKLLRSSDSFRTLSSTLTVFWSL